MSSLFKEAMVDAKALRDAALKSAESKVVEKYSNEVRASLRQLLEQGDDMADLGMGMDDLGGEEDPLMNLDDLGDDSGMGAAPAEGAPNPTGDESLEEDVKDVPYASTDDLSKMNGKNLEDLPDEGTPTEITLDLGALRESIEQLQAEIDEELSFDEDELAEMIEDDEEVDIDEVLVSNSGSDNLFAEEEDSEEEEGSVTDNGAGALAGSAAALSAASEAGSGPRGSTIAEDTEISDELIDSIVEKLTVDMGASLSGWAGRSDYSKKWEIEKELARRRGTEAQEELKNLKKAQEELVFENKQLNERLSQYKQVTGELKETLQDVNLSNARLLYTNRVLRNTSLNERQKKSIVEAISKAGSVTEARIIFNTLKDTAKSTQQTRRPQTLGEAIARPTSVIRATREEKAQPTDVFVDRMRRLAGIK